MEQELASQIRGWRKAQCLTQEQAAELLGLDARQYRRLEAGACYPQLDHTGGHGLGDEC